MKKFKFNLQTPLNIKRLREDLEKQRLSESIAKKTKEEARLFSLHSTKQSTRMLKEKALNSFVKIDKLNNFGDYLIGLENQIDLQEEELIKANKLYDSTRLSFIKAQQERKILEKFKEKRYRIYLDDINKEEQKISDELALSNFNRQKVE